MFGLAASPDFSCCTRTPKVALASTVHLSRNCVPFMDFQRRIHHYLPNNPASHVSKSILPVFLTRRFQWLPGLGRGSAALRLLGLRVRAPPRHGRLSLLKVVCRQVDVSAKDRLLVRMSLTEHGAFEFDLVTSTVRKPKASRDLKKNSVILHRTIFTTRPSIPFYDVTNLNPTWTNWQHIFLTVFPNCPGFNGTE